MTPVRFTNTEIAAKAKALYEEKIRATMRPEDSGKYLVIDVETGDYFMDADEIAVMKRAAENHAPDALYGMRVGFSTMGKIGMRQAAKT